MDTAARARQLAVVGLRGHPHPGQRYRHGWVPIAGSSIGSVLGSALSNAEIDDVYGEMDDSIEFGPGAIFDYGGDSSGAVGSIRLAADQPDRWYGFADFTQDEADKLAQDLDWAIGRAYDAKEHGHRAPDPVNGLLDWRTDDAGQVVGYGPDGVIRLGLAESGNDAAASNDVRIIDLSHEEATTLQRALEEFAGTDFSEEGS